jgi:hypothetical protein
MILEATHTHLYPGHSGKITGLVQIADLQKGRDCLVAFSDGSAATARITKSAKGWLLRTSAYRSAAGTAIPEKRWAVCLQQDGDRVKFRILRKAPENQR